MFQSSARPPLGLSTRAISSRARRPSNQWKAWATRTASALASATGMRSAVALERVCRRRGAGELLPHRGQRLDRDHLVEAPRQVPGQLAGAGGQVDDHALLVQAKLADERVDRLGRIAGAAALVLLRGVVERCRELLVAHHLERSRAFRPLLSRSIIGMQSKPSRWGCVPYEVACGRRLAEGLASRRSSARFSRAWLRRVEEARRFLAAEESDDPLALPGVPAACELILGHVERGR